MQFYSIHEESTLLGSSSPGCLIRIRRDKLQVLEGSYRTTSWNIAKNLNQNLKTNLDLSASRNLFGILPYHWQEPLVLLLGTTRKLSKSKLQNLLVSLPILSF